MIASKIRYINGSTLTGELGASGLPHHLERGVNGAICDLSAFRFLHALRRFRLVGELDGGVAPENVGVPLVKHVHTQDLVLKARREIEDIPHNADIVSLSAA